MDISKRLDQVASFAQRLINEIENIKKDLKIEENKESMEENKESMEENKESMEENKEFEELKNLLFSPKWPKAIPPDIICDLSSETDKQDRAEGILDLIINVHLENLKFLDFGCGEGHVVNQTLTHNPAMSVGYDIVKSDRWDKWDKKDNVLFTTNWKDVEKNGPYNVALLYDVIDHMELSDDMIVAELKKIKNVMAPKGRIFIRCHPWSSRHATHTYRKLNKAHIHLVFTPEELKKLQVEPMYVKKFIHPLAAYNNLFSKAGLNAGEPQILREGAEEFFKNNPIISKRIKANWKDSPDVNLKNGKVFPSPQTSMQFVDYVITVKP